MRLSASLMLVAVCTVSLLTGCTPSQPYYLNQTNELNYYLDRATEISYPDVTTAQLDEATQTLAPITVLNPDEFTFEDLTLEDVVSIALQNSKVIRGSDQPNLQGSAVFPGRDELAGPGLRGAGTLYNVAIAETEPGFLPALGSPGQPGILSSNSSLEFNRGVEAALAEFDAQYSSLVTFDKTDRPRNTIPSRAGVQFDRTQFQQESLNLTHQLSKKTATGTQLFFRSITDRVQNNIPADVQPLTSTWQQAFEAEVRQPLLRGRGAFVNRMPVIVARINTDVELARLESQLQNMVCNIEIRYWDLHCAYRVFETAQRSLNMSNYFRRKVQEQFDGGTATQGDLSQAIEQYHFFKTSMEQAFANLVDAENDLRWLMSWAPTDGRLIRTADEPLTAYVAVDWHQALNESHVRRPILREVRWEVKKKEMLLAYSRNSLLPQVNATATYRWLGLGDFLWGTERNGVPFPNTGSRALEELTGGDYQEVSVGLEFNTSIGFRRELANVRNAETKLARELAVLEDLELDVSRQLTMVVRAIDTNYSLAENNLARYAAAYDEFNSHRTYIEGGGAGTNQRIDRLLDAQRRQADSQNSYHRAICEYNKALALFHRRKGTIMEYVGVQFGEGPWPEKAYRDAHAHAVRRSASREMDYGWSRPGVISRGNAEGGIHQPILGHETIIYDEGFYPDQYYEYEEIMPGQGSPTPADPMDQSEVLIPGGTMETLDIEFRGANDDVSAAPEQEVSPQASVPALPPPFEQAAIGSGTPQVATNPGAPRVDSQVRLTGGTEPITQAELPVRSTNPATVVSGDASGVDALWQRMGRHADDSNEQKSQAVLRRAGNQ